MLVLSGSKRLEVGNYGPYLFEDFVPISKTRALISAGPSYANLSVIAEVDWDLGNPKILVEGGHLRLGHIYKGELIFSDGKHVPHQPFWHSTGKYWADGAPRARIFKDGEAFIDHFDGAEEIGKPWIYNGYIYFECRFAKNPVPFGWEIYRMNLKSGKKEQVVKPGANPCVFNKKLYYGVRGPEAFDIHVMDI